MCWHYHIIVLFVVVRTIKLNFFKILIFSVFFFSKKKGKKGGFLF